MAKKKDKAKVHQDLEGLNVKIDSMGELSSNLNIDKINDFLDKNVEDKKLNVEKKKDEDQK